MKMTLMPIKKGTLLELDIVDLAFGGKGIAKLDGFTIFVDGALPGQKVQAKISLKKRRHAEAKLVKVLKKSQDEIENSYQPIPGAPWAKLPIEKQMTVKKNQVIGLFKKLSHLDITPIFEEHIPSPENWFYRNKMDYSFGPTTETQNEEGEWRHSGFGLGSKKRGQYWLVEPLEKPSGIFDREFESLLPELSQICQSLNNTAYNSRTKTGFWRQLVVRKSFHEDQFLLNIITNYEAENNYDISKIVQFINTALPRKIKGIYWTQSDDVGNPNDRYQQRDLVFGEPKLIEKLNNLTFEISIDSFFQTNIFAAQELYQKVSSLISDTPEILELFAGTGTISQILARQNPKAQITSVEIVSSAVEDAKINAKKNNLSDIEFVCEDVFAFLKHYQKTPPTVILDPPRAGIIPKALLKILEFGPEEIIYVSCNAATLARDAQAITENEKYKFESISLVDQFPHTAHTECVAKFVKTK